MPEQEPSRSKPRAGVWLPVYVSRVLRVRFAGSVRIEGEIMYRNNSVRSVGVPEFSQANAGDFNSVVLAANAFYDLKGTKLGSADLRPYAGAGLAYIQELDTDIVSPSRSAQFSGNGLGFQLLAGVNLEWESGLRAEGSAPDGHRSARPS